MGTYEIFRDFGELFEEFGSISGPEEAILAVVMIILLVCFCIAILATVFNIVARWIFFNKCGERGWKAIIPVYNEITLLKLSGMNWWWIFFLYAAGLVSIFQTLFDVIEIRYPSYGLTTLSLFISLIAFVASAATILTKINECINLAKKFNKNGGYGVLLFFFEPIMFLVLGLSKDNKYDSKVKVSPNGFFGG